MTSHDCSDAIRARKTALPTQAIAVEPLTDEMAEFVKWVSHAGCVTPFTAWKARACIAQGKQDAEIERLTAIEAEKK